MAGLPPRLRKLEKELLRLGDGAMLVEEFDGFVAGLLVCPEMIAPSEWLPKVWSSADGDEPTFEGLEHVNRLLGPLMEHYNAVARTLIDRPESYAPLFPVDEVTGEVIWECWIEGFEKAVALRPNAWVPLRVADESARRAYAGLWTLIDAMRRDERLSKTEIDALIANGQEYIADWVVELSAWRLANYDPLTLASTPKTAFDEVNTKVGRNQPCPCGSGKKYKRCHGAN
ncbi:MAG: UPF0149 family protein [Erythrobacter sp.]